MTLLRDEEIKALITTKSANGVVTEVPNPPSIQSAEASGEVDEEWYQKDSSVQSASLDLHVGKILLPQAEKGKPGSVECPKKRHVLRTGHTVVITTQEKIYMPKNYAAIGFPPSSISSRGLLMTNPGHVDPGFVGRMRFTVINMGQEDIALNKSDAIVSLLFFRLDADVKRDWLERHEGVEAPEPTSDDLALLSQDFLDVSGRSVKAAKAALRESTLKTNLMTACISALVPILVSILGYIYLVADQNDQRMEEIKELREWIGAATLPTITKQLEDLRARIPAPSEESDN